MKIGVSACLLGEPCRYDGKSKPCDAVLELEKHHELIPICPEVAGGLPIPRPPSEIQADGSVKNCHGRDVTEEYRRGAELVLELLQREGCDVAILKEKSPACGTGRVYDGSFTGTLKSGNGICAQLLAESGISVMGESETDRMADL